MTEKSMDQQLWKRYSIASDNDRKFVDAKILDEIAEKELANKFQFQKWSMELYWKLNEK